MTKRNKLQTTWGEECSRQRKSRLSLRREAAWHVEGTGREGSMAGTE